MKRVARLCLGAMVLLSVGVIQHSQAFQGGLGPVLELHEGRSLSLSLQAGVMAQSGEARELVFDGSHKLSELTWDISGLFLAGGAVSAVFSDNFQVNLGYWRSVNKGNGSMDNYDWLFDSTSEWSHHSTGDVDINEASMLDISGAYCFHRDRGIELFGLLGYKQLIWDWSEFGRYHTYSVYGFRDVSGPLDGENGIDYKQTFRIPYAGIALRFSNPSISGSLYALFSPFVEAVADDHHILRSIKFRDTFKDIDYFAAGGDLNLDLNNDFFVSFSVDMHSIPEAKGDTRITDRFGRRTYLQNSSGIENNAFSLMLTAGKRL